MMMFRCSGVPGIPHQGGGQATWTSKGDVYSAAASIHFSDGGGGAKCETFQKISGAL